MTGLQSGTYDSDLYGRVAVIVSDLVARARHPGHIEGARHRPKNPRCVLLLQPPRSIQIAVGSIQIAVGSIQIAVGSIQITVGRIRLAVGSIRFTVGSIRITVGVAHNHSSC